MTLQWRYRLHHTGGGTGIQRSDLPQGVLIVGGDVKPLLPTIFLMSVPRGRCTLWALDSFLMLQGSVVFNLNRDFNPSNFLWASTE